MATEINKLKQIINLSEEQYTLLKSQGSITVDGVKYKYNPKIYAYLPPHYTPDSITFNIEDGVMTVKAIKDQNYTFTPTEIQNLLTGLNTRTGNLELSVNDLNTRTTSLETKTNELDTKVSDLELGVEDLQDEKLDKEVTQTNEDEETSVNLENTGIDFEVTMTQNGSVDRTMVIDKTGFRFFDNEAGTEIDPLINGKPIGGEIQPASKTVLGGIFMWTDENGQLNISTTAPQPEQPFINVQTGSRLNTQGSFSATQTGSTLKLI